MQSTRLRVTDELTFCPSVKHNFRGVVEEKERDAELWQPTVSNMSRCVVHLYKHELQSLHVRLRSYLRRVLQLT